MFFLTSNTQPLQQRQTECEELSKDGSELLEDMTSFSLSIILSAVFSLALVTSQLLLVNRNYEPLTLTMDFIL